MENISKNTFSALKHYVSVRLQQGVPLVDADWNEMDDIRRFELQSFIKHFIGDGVPIGNDGFRINPIINEQEYDFLIGAGRILLNGWEVVNESDPQEYLGIQYTEQQLYLDDSLAREWDVPALKKPELPSLPSTPPPEIIRRDAIILDVWEHPIDSSDDPDLDKILGIETCTRIKREWVVRLLQGQAEIDEFNENGNKQPNHAYYKLAEIEFYPDEENKPTPRIRDFRRTHVGCISNKNVGIGITEPKARLDIAQMTPGVKWLRLGDGGDSGRLWVEYKDYAPHLVLSDYDEPPKIRFQQIGISTQENSYTEEIPQFTSWIGHARGQSSDISIIGGNVGIGTTEPKVRLHIEGGNEAELTSGGSMIIGEIDSQNIVLDKNGIMSRNKSDRSPLLLQSNGGDIIVHSRLALPSFVINRDRKVGIGTKEPKGSLHIRSYFNDCPRSLILETAIHDEDSAKLCLNDLEDYSIIVGGVEKKDGSIRFYFKDDKNMYCAVLKAESIITK